VTGLPTIFSHLSYVSGSSGGKSTGGGGGGGMSISSLLGTNFFLAAEAMSPCVFLACDTFFKWAEPEMIMTALNTTRTSFLLSTLVMRVFFQKNITIYEQLNDNVIINYTLTLIINPHHFEYYKNNLKSSE